MNNAITKPLYEPDNLSEIIDVPDLGLTLRTILGIAARRMAATNHRTYTLRYKNMDIGRVKVRPHKNNLPQMEIA